MKKLTYYTSLVAMFLIPLFPLIVANHFFFPFITGKAFYFRILVEIAFASWAILACLDAKYRPKLTPLTIGVTLFTVVALVADVFGVNPIRSITSNFERMEGWLVIIHLWALYITATGLFSSGEEGKRMWHHWFNFSLFAGLIVAGYGLVQLFGWAPTHQGAGRLDASLGNSAYMAVYMLMNLGMAIYFFFGTTLATKKQSFYSWIYSVCSFTLIALLFVSYKNMTALIVNIAAIILAIVLYRFVLAVRPLAIGWLYSALSVIFAIVLIQTQTRGTILGLIGCVLLSLFLYAVLGKGEAKGARWTAGGVVIFIVALVLGFIAIRHQSWIESNPVLGRFSNVSWSDSSNQARQYIWPMAINGALKRPILGWGQENFNYIFNADYNPKMWSQEQWFDRAHNVFLDWFVASGFIGLFAYLALYVLFVMAVWKSSLSVIEKSMLTGLVAGYFVHNLFVFDNLASYVGFFALLGFANVVRNTSKDEVVIFGKNNMHVDYVEYAVAPIAILLLVAAVYFVNVRPIQANTRLIVALQACGAGQPSVDLFKNTLSVNSYMANQEIREQLYSCSSSSLTSQQVPNATKQDLYIFTGQAIKDQIKATPKDARVYLLAGSFYDSVSQYADGMPLLEMGHKLTPNKQTADFELANAYINTGSIDKAEALMKQAYEEDTTFPQAQIAYAITLVMNSKEAQAKTLFNNDPAIFGSTQMAQVYMQLKQYDKALAIYSAQAKANPTDVNAQATLAQAQMVAGRKTDAIATLKGIEKDHPELKDQVEAMIKSVQQ